MLHLYSWEGLQFHTAKSPLSPSQPPGGNLVPPPPLGGGGGGGGGGAGISRRPKSERANEGGWELKLSSLPPPSPFPPIYPYPSFARRHNVYELEGGGGGGKNLPPLPGHFVLFLLRTITTFFRWNFRPPLRSKGEVSPLRTCPDSLRTCVFFPFSLFPTAPSLSHRKDCF